MKIFGVLFLPVLLAFLLAYILHPCVVFLMKLGMKRVFSILSIFSILILLMAFLVYIGIPKFIQQIYAMKASLPFFLETYESIIHKITYETSGMPPFMQEKILSGITYFENWVAKGSEMVFRFLSAFVQNLLILLLVPFISYYMLKDYDRGIRRVLLTMPVGYRGIVSDYVVEVDDCIGKYIRSQLLVSLIVGGIATVAFYILGVDYALIFGMIIGITNVIPYFGPFIGALPVLLFALTVSKNLALFVLIVIVLIQFIESSVFGPIITAKTISMHPVTIILLLLVGGELWGILGMILIIPLFAFLKVTFHYIRQFVLFYRTEREI